MSEKTTVPNKGAVVLKFYATWCQPCKTIAPIIEEIKNETEGVDFLYVDADLDKELVQKYNIRGLPTVAFIRDGKIEDLLTGVQDKKTYQEHINLLLE